MAEVITRFKLETTQYDSKLRDASKALSAYSKQAELAGKDFDKFTKGQAETARSLGSISTSATNTKNKVKELVSAYNDVAKAYNNLTQQQKESDFGKAMAASLQQLQGRIRDAKSEMTDTGGVLSQLKDKFTVNVDALKLFSVGLTAAKAALDVAKDAFFASEATVDEWGRVVASSESVYQGFLTAINTGDISGYLNNINSIVNAARQAYNELDRLGTMKTIQSPAMSAQQTENDRFRAMIQTGRYIAPVDGRRATMKNGEVLSAEQIENLKRMLQNGMQKVIGLVGNEVKQTNRAIDAVYNRQAKELGLSIKEFRKGTSSMAEFDKRMEGYEKYKAFEAAHTATNISQSSAGATVTSHRDSVVNPYAEFAKWGTFRVDGDRYASLVNLIRQRDQQAGQTYSMQSQAYRSMNRTEGLTVSKIMGLSGGGGTGGGSSSSSNLPTMEEFWRSMTSNEQKLQDQKAAGDLVKDMPSPYQMMFDEIKKQYLDKQDADYGKDISKDWKVDKNGNLTNSSSNRHQESMARNLDKFTGYAEKTLGGVSNILGGVSQLGIEIPKDLQDVIGGIQGVISIVTGIASLVAMIEALTTIQTTESTIKSIPVIGWALAHGGIVRAANGYVPGNSYSGDRVPALLNSGELVLNSSQQNALANELQGNGIQNLNLHAQVEGEKILLVMNRHLKRTGKGEIVTWRE